MCYYIMGLGALKYRKYSLGRMDMNNKTVVNLGVQQFDKLIEENKFYVDKTGLSGNGGIAAPM